MPTGRARAAARRRLAGIHHACRRRDHQRHADSFGCRSKSFPQHLRRLPRRRRLSVALSSPQTTASGPQRGALPVPGQPGLPLPGQPLLPVPGRPGHNVAFYRSTAPGSSVSAWSLAPSCGAMGPCGRGLSRGPARGAVPGARTGAHTGGPHGGPIPGARTGGPFRGPARGAHTGVRMGGLYRAEHLRLSFP